MWIDLLWTFPCADLSVFLCFLQGINPGKNSSRTDLSPAVTELPRIKLAWAFSMLVLSLVEKAGV